MPLELHAAIESLASTGGAIAALAGGLTPDEARWRPAPEQWSVVEVVNHLADEEVEDFRTRLRLILFEPEQPFPPLDPVAAVTARSYAERDLGESLERFRAAREESLRWLATLDPAQLERSREHRALGSMNGWRMLASWVAHDLHHVRQLNRLRYERLAAAVAPLSLAYAGDW